LQGKIWPGLIALAMATTSMSSALAQQSQKPNILVIMADGNISSDNRGMMGYRTPNIDRIASEGAIFTVEQALEMLRLPPSGN
jgi:arylsulfatase A-like enzyme